MVEQTNLYATQCKEAMGDRIGPHSLLTDMKPVTYEELRRFFGLLFLMGIVDKPDIKSYWSTNPLLDTPIFRNSMSRNRFESILMVFHLVDNTANLPREDPDHDKLYKIRPPLSHLQSRFTEVYRPQQNLSIDESMMPWRGRVAFRQFIPSKPIRYGIKLYLCCESKSSFVCKMDIYSGKKGDQVEKDHGPNVVKRFADSFSGLGHTVFIDSFFSSVELYEHLRKQGTTATGTIRKDRRGLPSQLGAVKLQKGQTCELKRDIQGNHGDPDDQSASLHAVRFHDKKLVTLLTTCSHGSRVDSGKKSRTGEAVVIPKLVHEYNQNMNGVDKFDQHLQYYSFNRKTWKWWKRACFHLLHIAKIQAYLLFKIRNPQSKQSQLDFTLGLVQQMLADAPPPNLFKRRMSDPPGRLKEKHFLTKVPPTEKKK